MFLFILNNNLGPPYLAPFLRYSDNRKYKSDFYPVLYSTAPVTGEKTRMTALLGRERISTIVVLIKCHERTDGQHLISRVTFMTESSERRRAINRS